MVDEEALEYYKKIEMNNEELIKNIYMTVIEDGITQYKDMYESEGVSEPTTDYGKCVSELYHLFNEKQKDMFMVILKQIMIDTISHVFGLLDGCTSLYGGGYVEAEIKINGLSTEEELQDTFLRFIEENPN